jgi:endonuclease-8
VEVMAAPKNSGGSAPLAQVLWACHKTLAMPEGPSIVILKEAVQPFKGQKILEATGNTKSIDKDGLVNQPVVDFKSWGKHFLICLPDYSIRVHFLLFGSYSINEQTRATPRLALRFANGTLYFYTSSVLKMEEPLDTVYDWTADVMNDCWNAAAARKKIKAMPATLVCDALLDQHIFAGSGNIIKNEVLFRTRIHPESKVGNLPPRKLSELIKAVRNYSFDFLAWKKAFELKKHWLAHTKKLCPRCSLPLIKKYLGKTKRRTFYCENCQVKYA